MNAVNGETKTIICSDYSLDSALDKVDGVFFSAKIEKVAVILGSVVGAFLMLAAVILGSLAVVPLGFTVAIGGLGVLLVTIVVLTCKLRVEREFRGGRQVVEEKKAQQEFLDAVERCYPQGCPQEVIEFVEFVLREDLTKEELIEVTSFLKRFSDFKGAVDVRMLYLPGSRLFKNLSEGVREKLDRCGLKKLLEICQEASMKEFLNVLCAQQEG